MQNTAIRFAFVSNIINMRAPIHKIVPEIEHIKTRQESENRIKPPSIKGMKIESQM